MAEHEPKETISYKDTLNLPTTDFPIRADAKKDDPAIIERWEKEQLFAASFTHNKGKEKFIYHDGPPYANANIHVGSAYNKILKDIATKARRMMGYHVPIIPGWDCHGLPIELKVTQEKPGLSPIELKKACRAYANHWMQVQREEFKSLGILMNWDKPYLTMDPSYESAIMRAFGIFLQKGYIERKNKTVPWCATDQTVLATAEIEYADRKDPSLYVLFALQPGTLDNMFPALSGQPIYCAIWTTTAWTLPFNRAVLIKPNTSYSILNINGKLIAVGSALADSLCALLKVGKEEVAQFNSDDLLALNPKIHHPFLPNLIVPLISSETVQLSEGTAFVHCAPGCGPEDYEVGVKNHLEIFSPITPDGKYAAGIKPEVLENMPVSEAHGWVIKELMAQDRLLFKTSIKHSYPHCWRCRNGLIFRATKQWFCDLSKNDLKEKAVAAVDTVNMLPLTGANRLKATLEGRLEWCLSRQRIWGVPIPAFICKNCDYTYCTIELIEKVAQGVEKDGIEFWDSVTPQGYLPKDFKCPKCEHTHFIKEQDILDVWFDSGISHYAVLEKNKDLGFPADLYLEGKDQHRGWFQSSLLTALVIEGKAPFKTILTHGFTVDEQGRKMSKSLGNVVTPAQMIEQLGTDGLRLWAASIDYSGDAVISAALLENVKEVYRKIRNTARFLLSNLYDFDIKKDAVPFDELLAVDQYALHELIVVNANCIAAYDSYDFTSLFHALGDYCAKDLSALYLDVIKDRLYVEKADGKKRRSAQTVCWYILDTLTRLSAPILSFTAEQISDHYQKDKKSSIHLQSFVSLTHIWNELNKVDAIDSEKEGVMDVFAVLHMKETLQEHAYMKTWQELLLVRSAVLKAIEKLREQSIVKHSLEARITLYFDLSKKELLASFFESLKSFGSQNLQAFFKEFFIVSQVEIQANQQGLSETEYPGLYAKVEHAKGFKCPRCWNWDETDHVHHLCKRCQECLSKL